MKGEKKNNSDQKEEKKEKKPKKEADNKPITVHKPSKDQAQLTFAERRKLAETKIKTVINTKYGQGSIRGGTTRIYKTVPRISSGSFIMDYALGGGWPRGRISVPWGKKSCSKTTSMLRMVADAQKRDVFTNKYIFNLAGEAKENAIPMKVGWVDAEGVFDPNWAMLLGVDLELIDILCPGSQEEACNTIEVMITSGAYDVVVLDSLAALSPAKEIDGDVADEHVGLAARRNNRMFRKIQMRMNEVAKVNPILTPTFFSINQERINIKVTFGDPRIKPGGNGQDFFSSVEVLFWGNQVTYFDSDKKSPKSSSFGFKVVKNKISPPMIQGEYEQALVDDPAGNFFAGDVIEIGTVMEFAKKFKVFEEVEQSKTKKVWKMYGQTFERKKDVLQQWCHDKEKFSLLKEDLIARIFKRVHIDAEKRENERSNAGIEG